MEHFVPPEIPETDFLKINTLKKFRFVILLVAQVIFSHIALISYFQYMKKSYQEDIIPELILKNNLYGIEIDKRAADLSYFSLIIKARENKETF